MHESESESEVAQSCPTLRNPMDCSPPGSPVYGIFQARVLEWGATAFSVSVLSTTPEFTVSKMGKEVITHSSILAWEIPWTEEPGGLQSMGSPRVRYD